jgi:predicted ribosome quality control (RQC) complex YloA/Tae2 family protein
MNKTSVFELRAAAVEANAVLVGARLAKFFEVAPGVFRLKLNSQSKGEVNVLVDLSFGAFLASRVPPSPEAPTRFAAAVRSRIDNAVLKNVCLVNNDRIVRFDFEKKEIFSLVFEFVGKGNALLLDAANGKIVFVWKPAKYSSRKLFVREIYSPPPAGGNAPAETSAVRTSAEIEAAYWVVEKPVEKKENRALAALEKSLAAQRAALPELEREEREALAAGGWIREHRSECEEIISGAKAGDAAVLKKRGARKNGAFVEADV